MRNSFFIARLRKLARPALAAAAVALVSVGMSGCLEAGDGPMPVAATQEDGPQITVNQTPPEISRHTFNAAHPPADMPPMNPGEAAITQSNYACESTVDVLVIGHQPIVSGGKNAVQATVKVTSFTVKLKLSVAIWDPIICTEKLKNHEEGHRQIAEMEYEPAGKVAEKLARQQIGREYKGIGPDTDAAAKAAIQNVAHDFCQSYLAAVAEPAERVQERYDEITDHGRNKVVEADAIRQAMKASDMQAAGK